MDAAQKCRLFSILRCTLKLPIGLRKGGRTGGLGVAQVPEHATTDNGREIDLGSETATGASRRPGNTWAGADHTG